MDKKIKISPRLVRDRHILTDPRRPRRRHIIFKESYFKLKKKQSPRIARIMREISGEFID